MIDDRAMMLTTPVRPQFVEVVEGATTPTYGEAGAHCGGDVVLGLLHRQREGEALGQPGGDGRCQGAAGAVVVGCINALRGEGQEVRTVVQDIGGRAFDAARLYQCAPCAKLVDQAHWPLS